MDEQPKRRPGRPKGTSKHITTQANERNKKGDTSLVLPGIQSISATEDGKSGGAVPDLIAACLTIRQDVDIEDPASLNSALAKYLQLCSMSGMKISNSMLYFSCNVTRTMVYDWYHGRTKKANPEYKRFAAMVKEICTAAREQYGLEGQVNPILTIFHQKYYDGFREDTQTDDMRDPLGENQDPAKLAEKYKDIIVD